MKFSCEKYMLFEAANISSRAASSKSPVPALEGLLISASGDGSVRITGYDLKKGIYTQFPADVSEPGSAVIKARLFCEILRNLPEGIVEITVYSGNTCEIVCGNAEYRIMGNDPEDYPELPSVDRQNSLSMPQKTIKKMINETIFAVSDNESRPVYTGSLFEISGGRLCIVSVDGFRLALRCEPIEGENDCVFIVPGSALSELEKICSDVENPVTITLGTKHISFGVGDTTLVSRRLDGEFLDYRTAIPAQYACEIIVDREELLRAVDRVSLVIDEKSKNPLRCIFGMDNIKLFCVTALGNAEDICPSAGDGGGLEIGFNNRYLRDALKSAPTDKLKLRMSSSTTPCVIAPLDGDSFSYMILPVRLRAEQ